MMFDDNGRKFVFSVSACLVTEFLLLVSACLVIGKVS